MSTTHRTAAYLDDLARMLADLDPDERADVLDGVRDHVDAALGSLDREPSAADVDHVLAELGSPGDVAREALAGRAPRVTAAAAPPSRPTLSHAWVPPTAVGLIFLGAALGVFILPLALLLAGLVMLWASPLWTAGEKALGTILPVLGILGVPVGSLLVFRVSDGAESAVTPLGYLLLAAAAAGLVMLVLLAVRGGRRAARWMVR